MANDVRLKIGGDTSELEKAFSTLIKKIQSDADKLKIGPNAKAAPNTQVNTERELSRNKSFTDAQLKSYQNILKSLKEEYTLLQQIGREREKQARQEHLSNIQKTTFAQIQRNQASGWAARGGGFAGGGIPPSPPPASPPSGGQFGKMPSGGINSLAGLASFLGVPGMAIAGIGTALAGVKAAEATRRFIAESALRANIAESNAFNTKGQAGYLLTSAFNGGAPEDIMFGAQRAQAAGLASSAIDARYRSGGITGAIGNALIPGYGLIAQSRFGSALGAFEGGQFRQGFRALGGALGSSGLQREFEANRATEQADEQVRQEDALKNGPSGKVRTEVANKYLRDWRRNLDFQRQSGLSESEFRRFLGGINGAGFQDELGLSAASAIQGAGGSTRAMTGNAAFALQMGRQFDLTNAGQAIGAISGQLGGSQQSKDALIAIQAEGTRIGLNRSDMREENRRFVEMAASVINQSNATSGAGVDQLLSTFTKFMSGANTTAGLQAGQNAYEAYQRQSNIQSGPSAAMRAAGMRSDAILGKLTERDRAKLSTMPESEITPDSLVIQEMAKRQGVSTQAIVDQYHQVIGQSLFVNPTTDKAIDRLKQAKQNPFVVAPGETDLARGAAAGEVSLEQAFGGMSEKDRLRAVEALSSGDYKGLASLQAQIGSQAASSGRPRPGDEMEKQQAEASRMANELFDSLKDHIVPASEATEKFIAKINALVSAMNGSDQAKINAALHALSPTDQTHAGTGGAPR